MRAPHRFKRAAVVYTELYKIVLNLFPSIGYNVYGDILGWIETSLTR